MLALNTNKKCVVNFDWKIFFYGSIFWRFCTATLQQLLLLYFTGRCLKPLLPPDHSGIYIPSMGINTFHIFPKHFQHFCEILDIAHFCELSLARSWLFFWGESGNNWRSKLRSVLLLFFMLLIVCIALLVAVHHG